MSYSLLTLLVLITASWKADSLDDADLDATFATVFTKLPKEVTVFPSENYYYWKIETAAGITVSGNVRLAANTRDRGELSFAAAGDYKTFTASDGLAIERRDRLTYAVTFKEKRVIFHLNPLVQKPPEKFELGGHERFVERTFDESGLQFILLFNTRFNDFIWILNEEEDVAVPENFEVREHALIGKRTGFIFWDDSGKRKVLAAVSDAHISANNYFDGPFDQLADNDAKQVDIKKYFALRDPDIANQIDAFGNYKNREPPTRIALTNYLIYKTQDEATAFIRKAQQSADPYRHISKRGKYGPRPPKRIIMR